MRGFPSPAVYFEWPCSVKHLMLLLASIFVISGCSHVAFDAELSLQILSGSSIVWLRA